MHELLQDQNLKASRTGYSIGKKHLLRVKTREDESHLIIWCIRVYDEPFKKSTQSRRRWKFSQVLCVRRRPQLYDYLRAIKSAAATTAELPPARRRPAHTSGINASQQKPGVNGLCLYKFKFSPCAANVLITNQVAGGLVKLKLCLCVCLSFCGGESSADLAGQVESAANALAASAARIYS